MSKGTYIRSLIEDLAEYLGTVGTMASLTRTKQGEYSLEECVTLSDLEKGNYNFHDISSILSKYPVITVNTYLENRIKNGSILENRNYDDVILFQSEDGTPLALYQIYEKDNTKIKPWKML